MSGLDNMRIRLSYLGENSEERFNKLKLASFKDALKNSYQSSTIKNLSNGRKYKCLINPDSVRPNYDNKVISIEKDSNFKIGDAFEWLENNTYWIVYLQELTETAYFRAYIRRCKHKIMVNDIDYYVYVKGPSESAAKWNIKENVIANELNESIELYVQKNDDTLNFFKRFNKITLDNRSWEIISVDSISMEGIIEVSLKEAFINTSETLIEPKIVPVIDASLPHIVGPLFVKPYSTNSYTVQMSGGGEWSVSNSKAKILNSNELEVTLEIVTGRSGTFDLIYSKDGAPAVVALITIESL